MDDQHTRLVLFVKLKKKPPHDAKILFECLACLIDSKLFLMRHYYRVA
jgi:hypothetical protein